MYKWWAKLSPEGNIHSQQLSKNSPGPEWKEISNKIAQRFLGRSHRYLFQEQGETITVRKKRMVKLIVDTLRIRPNDKDEVGIAVDGLMEGQETYVLVDGKRMKITKGKPIRIKRKDAGTVQVSLDDPTLVDEGYHKGRVAIDVSEDIEE